MLSSSSSIIIGFVCVLEEVFDQSDELLLRSDKRLETGVVWLVCSQYGDSADQVGVS